MNKSVFLMQKLSMAGLGFPKRVIRSRCGKPKPRGLGPTTPSRSWTHVGYRILSGGWFSLGCLLDRNQDARLHTYQKCSGCRYPQWIAASALRSTSGLHGLHPYATFLVTPPTRPTAVFRDVRIGVRILAAGTHGKNRGKCVVRSSSASMMRRACRGLGSLKHAHPRLEQALQQGRGHGWCC